MCTNYFPSSRSTSLSGCRVRRGLPETIRRAISSSPRLLLVPGFSWIPLALFGSRMLVEFVEGSLVSLGGEGVGPAPSGAATGWCAGEPGLFVFRAAGEPTRSDGAPVRRVKL